MKGFVQDAGYGDLGNRSKKFFLENMLTEEQRKEYEKQLEKENPKKYYAFKEWIELGEKCKKYSEDKNK